LGGTAITKHSQVFAVLFIALTLLASAVVALNVADADAAEDSAWTTLAAMPTERAGFGLASVAGKIYAIGGINSNNQPLTTVEEYNPTINEWKNKRSMPTARSGAAVAVYDGKIYVVGGAVGEGFVANNEIYDPKTNTWSTGTSMPTPRADFSAEIVNDAIYLIGGKKYSSTDPFYVETNNNEVYYPANDSWSTKTALPMAVQGCASAVVDNKIYIIGGSRDTLSIVNSNQVYNTQTDTWTTAAPLPGTSSYGTAAATTGYSAPKAIYYIGGFSGQDFRQTAKTFNLSNNTWSDIEPMPTARGYLGLVTVNDLLYAIGGFDGTNYLTTNERYQPVGYGSVAPIVQITSPENRTYREVTLDYATNRGVNWLGYSLDGHANVTVTAPVTMHGLSQGGHQIVMYANDSQGNMGTSNTVHFSIDSIAPIIVFLSPTNQSYDTNDVQLTFLVNEDTAVLEYSLDGQQNVQIVGNVTLVALSNGPHRITVYAADSLGNVDQMTVHFEVAPFPTLQVIAALVIVTIVVAVAYILLKFGKPKRPQPSKPAAPKAQKPHEPA
jgi:N-acetylneuraminic acid mutarotase